MRHLTYYTPCSARCYWSQFCLRYDPDASTNLSRECNETNDYARRMPTYRRIEEASGDN